MIRAANGHEVRIQYLVLTKGIWHASGITLDLDIHLTKLLESAANRKLKLLICQGRNQASSFQQDTAERLYELLTLPRKRTRLAGIKPEHYLPKLQPALCLHVGDRKVTQSPCHSHMVRHLQHYHHCPLNHHVR